jgi:hypothetical protein
MRLANKILGGKSEVKKILGSPVRRWDDNIKVDLGEIGPEDVDWIHLAHDRYRWRALVNTLTKPSSSIKGGKFLA